MLLLRLWVHTALSLFLSFLGPRTTATTRWVSQLGIRRDDEMKDNMSYPAKEFTNLVKLSPKDNGVPGFVDFATSLKIQVKE